MSETCSCGHLRAEHKRGFATGCSRCMCLTTEYEATPILTLCWFLRWVLDEDERRALREFRLEYLLFFEAGVRASEERFVDAHRELQRRGF